MAAEPEVANDLPQRPASASSLPRTLHDYPGAGFSVQDDSEAKKIVDEILGHFGLSENNWKISVTEDNQTTPYAIGRYWPDGRREILFNKEFMKKITEGAGKWPAYCVAAHEIGHHIGLHLETTPVRLQEFELRADYYCGFLLGRLNSAYDDAISAINFIGNSAGYPTREQRIKFIGQGWKDATGKGLPDDARLVASATTLSVQPQPIVPLVNFKTAVNRDLDGYDITTTNGKPGIQGVTLVECANTCLKKGDCKGFSFDKWNGWCFLKNKISTSRIDPHSIISVRKPQKLPNVSTAEIKTVIMKGRRFRDTPFLQAKSENRDACKSKCEQQKDRCVAFNYLKEDAAINCELFTESAGHYPDPKSDIGFRQQEPKTTD